MSLASIQDFMLSRSTKSSRVFAIRSHYLGFCRVVYNQGESSKRGDGKMARMDHVKMHVALHRYPGRMGLVHHRALLIQVFQVEAWYAK